MVTVQRVHLPSNIPVAGCEITPYVQLMHLDNTVSTEDVTDAAPVDGQFLRYRWFRIENDNKVPMCSIHPSVKATQQCICCSKAKLLIAKSYHCSADCFKDAWPYHRAVHKNTVNEGSGTSLSSSQSSTSSPNSTTLFRPRAVFQQNGETWFEVGCSKTYTPAADDVGHVLKFECVVANAETKFYVGKAISILTSHVIPAPSPIPRRIISLSDSDARSSADLTFSVLSYNILSESHATNDLYGYCPPWALSWPYRRQNLLSEIVGYHADIICLQEVQKDHFEEFFKPELDKHGYEALFMRNSTEDLNGNKNAVVGCATFFRNERFSLVRKYQVEFNKAARSLTDATLSDAQKKPALARLIKDNVAVILELEAKVGVQGSDSTGKGQVVCVANAHVNVPPELKDVKLWQVRTLIKGLEKVANSSGKIPALVCGDFSSLPGSAPHSLLAMGRVDPMHPDMGYDPFGILQPSSKLTHLLPLVSAYASFARTVARPVPGIEQQRKRMDPTTNEPLFTKFTRDFIGTHDYIFYTADSLTVEGILELLDEHGLRKNTALPSPEWSSDHVALLARFRCKPKTKR